MYQARQMLVLRATYSDARVRLSCRFSDALPRLLGKTVAAALRIPELPSNLMVVATPKRGGAADYQVNVGAFSKVSGRPAPECAVAIADGVNEMHAAGAFVKASSSGAYVNLRLSDSWLVDAALSAGTPPVVDRASPAATPGASQPRVLIDYSSPNLGKQLHVGHLRSSLIGDSLARILEASGAEVHRVSHVGDCGLPVALVVAEILTEPALRMRLAAMLEAALRLGLAEPADASGASVTGAETDDAALPPDPHAPARSWLAARVPLDLLPSAKELSAAYEAGKRRASAAESARAAAGPEEAVKAEMRSDSAGADPSPNAGATAAAFAGAAPDAQAVLGVLQGVLVSPPVVDWDSVRAALALLSAHSSQDGTLPTYAMLVYVCWHVVGLASRAGYMPLLTSLGVRVPERGESVYAWQLDRVIGDLLAQGVAVDTRGAVGVFTDGPERPPLLLRRASGAWLYAATDAAALRARLAAGFDRIVYVTDDGQAPHFAAVFAMARLAGWVDADGRNRLADGGGQPRPVALEHAAFGLVTGPDGRKLSSRDGTDLTLASLLEQGVAAVQNLSASSARSWTGVDEPVSGDKATAAAIAYSAIRYFDLAHSRRASYAFSYEKALALHGNTAVYLMYAVSRLRALRRRGAAAAGLDTTGLSVADQWAAVVAHWEGSDDASASSSLPPPVPAERQLALVLLRFPEALAGAARGLAPHHLVAHAHELAGDFHIFYSGHRVLPRGTGYDALASLDVSAEVRGESSPADFATASQTAAAPTAARDSEPLTGAMTARRLRLCAAVERVLVKSCGLLGVECLDRI